MTILILLSASAMSAELSRYRGAARDGGTLKYIFESEEQDAPKNRYKRASRLTSNGGEKACHFGPLPERSHALLAHQFGRAFFLVRSSDRQIVLQGRGVTLYAHTADKCLRLHQQPIPCRLREAAFVLDGLVEHDTELDPRTCYTDTNVYFSLLLLGCGFSWMNSSCGGIRITIAVKF